MRRREDGHSRRKYTLEVKVEAVRLVKAGQSVPVMEMILGVPWPTLGY